MEIALFYQERNLIRRDNAMEGTIPTMETDLEEESLEDEDEELP
jgi:hypothetical protein